MSFNIAGEYSPREYTAISTDNGIVLCDKRDGAFIVLRFAEDIERLQSLLCGLEIIKPTGDQ